MGSVNVAISPSATHAVIVVLATARLPRDAARDPSSVVREDGAPASAMASRLNINSAGSATDRRTDGRTDSDRSFNIVPAHIGAFPCSEALRSFSEFYLYFLRRFSRSTRHLPSCLFCVNFRNWKSRKKPQECGQPFSPSLRLMSTLEPRARRSLVLCSNLIRSLLRCLPHPQSMPPSPPSPPSKSSPDFLNSVGHKETVFFPMLGTYFGRCWDSPISGTEKNSCGTASLLIQCSVRRRPLSYG